MIGHFNAGELASYRAGSVSDGKAARISAHLTSCPQCADVHSALGDVSQMLASVRVPAMPETLDQRLQAAIADEAAQRAARAVAPASDASSPARMPDRPERSRRPARRPLIRARSPQLLRGLAAAGVLVLLIGGGILLANQRGVGTSNSGAAPAYRPVRSRPGGVAVGSVATIRLRYRQGGQYLYANALTSEANYTKADLPAGIRREVHSSAQLANPSVKLPATSAQPAPQHTVSDTTVAQLESCLSVVAVGHLVQLVEVARYLGRPATIIVFKPVDSVFDVIVVGEACGPAGRDIIATLTVPAR